MNKYLYLLTLTVVCNFCTPAIAQKELKINVKEYGAMGDGKSNDFQALKKVFDAISGNGGGEVYFPAGTYFIDEYHTPENNMPNLVIRNCNNLKISGNNAIISVKGDFHRPATRVSKKNNIYSNTFAITPIIIQDCKNVVIQDLEIRGNIQLTTRDPKVAESGGRLLFIGTSENVTLKNLFLHHAQMDGLYISDSKNLTADNIISSNNARQGMTIVALQNGTFTNCKFINTGVTDGAYGRHGPSAGLDIEPNTTKEIVNNVTFSNCLFENNLGAQVLVSRPVNTTNVTFNKCTINASLNSTKRTIIVNASKVLFQNCLIDCKDGSIYPVWHKPQVSSTFSNCIVKSSASAFVAVEDGSSKDVIIENCTLEYTGNTILKSFFPYLKMKTLTFRNNKINIPTKYYRPNGMSSLIQKARSVSGNRFYSNGKEQTAPQASFSGSNMSN